MPFIVVIEKARETQVIDSNSGMVKQKYAVSNWQYLKPQS